VRFTAALLVAASLAACSHPPPPTGVPERIVCLSCAGTDIFDALGAMDRVVAVEEDCPLPCAANVVKIRNEDHPGKLAAFNVESVLALHPDAVIAQPDLKPALEGRGLRIIWTVDHYTYDNVPDLVIKIGKLLEMPDRAQALLDHMYEKVEEIQAKTKGLPRVKVYFEATDIGTTVGAGGVLDKMIEVAGGINIAHDVQRHWCNLTPEAIFLADPDVIIMGPWAGSVDDVYARPGWERLKAVREKRVYKLEPPNRNVAQGTPRCVDGCEKYLLRWLHPEVFGDKPEEH
jgi:iron complex transport system substrate-binding protein